VTAEHRTAVSAAEQAALTALGFGPAGPLAERHLWMEADEAAALAARWWGVEGGVRRLAAEKDDTFLIETTDGQGVVLKVAAPSERLIDLEFETALTAHINAAGVGITVPDSLRTDDGRQIVPITDHAGQDRLMRLITLIPGTPMIGRPLAAEHRAVVGETLARLQHATRDFAHPGDGRVSAWDTLHLPDLAPLIVHVDAPAHRALLEQVVAAFLEHVQPRVAALRTQVVHNDFNGSNILVDDDHPGYVTGIIDFGDAVRTAVAVDLATALSYHLPSAPAALSDADVLAPSRALVAGYLRAGELIEPERELLAQLMRARLAVRALISFHRAQLFPENAAYVLRNSAPIWAQLQWFSGRGADELATIFR
jgi:hydroxylysine kinase